MFKTFSTDSSIRGIQIKTLKFNLQPEWLRERDRCCFITGERGMLIQGQGESKTTDVLITTEISMRIPQRAKNMYLPLSLSVQLGNIYSVDFTSYYRDTPWQY